MNAFHLHSWAVTVAVLMGLAITYSFSMIPVPITRTSMRPSIRIFSETINGKSNLDTELRIEDFVDEHPESVGTLDNSIPDELISETDEEDEQTKTDRKHMDLAIQIANSV